jgi:hypothetical protein
MILLLTVNKKHKCNVTLINVISNDTTTVFMSIVVVSSIVTDMCKIAVTFANENGP